MYLGSAKNLRIRNLLHFYCRLLTKKEAIQATRWEFLRGINVVLLWQSEFYPMRIE
jgi:hypothetical protein